MQVKLVAKNFYLLLIVPKLIGTTKCSKQKQINVLRQNCYIIFLVEESMKDMDKDTKQRIVENLLKWQIMLSPTEWEQMRI